MSLAALIRRVVGHLESAAIAYMITGSVASSYHGEPRATRDLDVVIDPDARSLSTLVERLRRDGLYVDAEAARTALIERSQFNAVDASTGWKVDFLIRKDRPFSREELSRRMPADLLGTQAAIATAEDTIIAKLEWATGTGSDRQRADVSALVEIGRGGLDLDYIDRWTAALGLRDVWLTLRNP